MRLPYQLAPHPLLAQAHNSSVRTLVSGKSEILVSGDAEGYVNFFLVPPKVKVKAPPMPDFLDLASIVQESCNAKALHLSMDGLKEVTPFVKPVMSTCEEEFSDSLSPQHDCASASGGSTESSSSAESGRELAVYALDTAFAAPCAALPGTKVDSSNGLANSTFVGDADTEDDMHVELTAASVSAGSHYRVVKSVVS